MLDSRPTTDELRDLIALTLTPGVGPVRVSALLDRFGSADRVWTAQAVELKQTRGIGAKTAAAICRPALDLKDRVAEELEAIDRVGAAVLVRGRAGYPELLSPLPDAPALLTCVGSLDGCRGALDRIGPSVGVVGSRRCTHYGLEQTRAFSAALATQGYSVVSGGARGIDSESHRVSLDAGGVTVAVLGSGIEVPYPPENEQLFDRIISSDRGFVISELPISAPPIAENFPARNRIISGMSLGVLVVEADIRSGALITARLAAEEHGREVMAIPGRIGDATSRGALELIKKGGAFLVTEPADVASLLDEPARRAGLRARSNTGTDTSPHTSSTPNESERPTDPVLKHLTEPMSFDELIERSGMSAGMLRAHLTSLEIQFLVHRLHDKWVTRAP